MLSQRRTANENGEKPASQKILLEVEVTPPLEINLSGGGGGKGVACEAIPGEATRFRSCLPHHSTNYMYM